MLPRTPDPDYACARGVASCVCVTRPCSESTESSAAGRSEVWSVACTSGGLSPRKGVSKTTPSFYIFVQSTGPRQEASSVCHPRKPTLERAGGAAKECLEGARGHRSSKGVVVELMEKVFRYSLADM